MAHSNGSRKLQSNVSKIYISEKIGENRGGFNPDECAMYRRMIDEMLKI